MAISGWPLVFVLVLLALFAAYTAVMALPAFKTMVTETRDHKKITANLERMNAVGLDQFFGPSTGEGTPLIFVRERRAERVSKHSPLSVVEDCIVRDASGAYWHCIVRSTNGAGEASVVPNLIGELRARRALFNNPAHYRAVFKQEPRIEDIRRLDSESTHSKIDSEYLPN
jgi:hypothetical protein